MPLWILWFGGVDGERREKMNWYPRDQWLVDNFVDNHEAIAGEAPLHLLSKLYYHKSSSLLKIGVEFSL